VYGHYDVQPANPLELWETPPFEPTIKDNKLYARGATDDKGQLFLYVKLVEAWLRTTGTMPVNVKFCIEGEEELNCLHTPAFIEAHQELLAADMVVLSDTQMIEKGKPAIVHGLRGGIGVEVEVQAANKDLHSGIYGGGVPNALHALTKLLHSFHKEDGTVAVEGFYDTVRTLTDAERESLARQGTDEAKIREEFGLSELFGEPGYSFIERTTARPTLEVVSVSGGVMKPIVPSKAVARIISRLVADQKPEEVMDVLESHILKHTPPYVQSTMKRLNRGNPYLTPVDHPVMQAASQAYEAVYGMAPVFTRAGGSIAVVEVFSRLLDAPVVMMGFGLPEENMHAPNEYFDLDNFDMGLRTLALYWEKLGSLIIT
jgi:acetylornithine deacetylase/succinyl-diaminopimelate desuccinylase-like protein